MMPSDFLLRRRNQAVLAERLRWPAGALQACADLEDRHPGWYVSWMIENVTPGWERPAGFHATYEGVHHRAEAFRTDVRDIAEVMAAEIPEHEWDPIHGKLCAWCVQHLPPGQRTARL
jgi:hypothetical protein